MVSYLSDCHWRLNDRYTSGTNVPTYVEASITQQMYTPPPHGLDVSVGS